MQIIIRSKIDIVCDTNMLIVAINSAKKVISIDVNYIDWRTLNVTIIAIEFNCK